MRLQKPNNDRSYMDTHTVPYHRNTYDTTEIPFQFGVYIYPKINETKSWTMFDKKVKYK